MLKILLWAPFGAGDHYWGPGQSAFNLYSNKTNQICLSIVHGYKDHRKYDLYDQQFFISDLKKENKASLLKFLYHSKKWIENNAHKFDIAHVLTDHHPSFLPALWLEKAGVKTFLKIAGGKGNLIENSLLSKATGLYKYMQAHKNDLTGYIAISAQIERELFEIGVKKEKIHFIPNGVNSKRFHPVNKAIKNELREKHRLKGEFIVLFTGSITKRKNPSIIVDSFRYFKNDPSIHLLIIGPDRVNQDERKKIHRILENNSITNVTTLPFQKNIEEFYQASDLFILPSENEGLSNSLLEAQACGLPALVTKISGSEDLIEDGYNGLFIKPDANDIHEKINCFYKASTSRLNFSENSRQKVSNKYSSQKIFNKHIQLFKTF